MIEKEGLGTVAGADGVENPPRRHLADFGIQRRGAGLGGQLHEREDLQGTQGGQLGVEAALDQQVERSVEEQSARAGHEFLHDTFDGVRTVALLLEAANVRRERPHRPRVRLGGGGEEAIAADATRLRLQPDMRQLVGDEMRRERQRNRLGGGDLRTVTTWRLRPCFHAICARPAIQAGSLSSAISTG